MICQLKRASHLHLRSALEVAAEPEVAAEFGTTELCTLGSQYSVLRDDASVFTVYVRRY